MGFWRTRDFNPYDAVLTETQIEYIYGANAEAECGVYDATQSPYRIVFHFADAVFETVLEGDNAGDERAIDGSVTGFTFYNQSGEVIMKATEMNGDLAFFLRTIDKGDDWRGMDSLYAQPIVFVGTNNNGADPGDWDGDNIQTGSHNDIVRAKAGDDFIQDNGGKDKYVGGDGWDTLSYETFQWSTINAFSGLRADLRKGYIDGPDGHRDTVVSIESVRGTQKRDVFIGNSDDNGFMGYAGKDVLKGGGGSDWASYRNDYRDGGDFGINVKLHKGWIRDGFGSKDKVKSIENVVGTDLSDRFRDDAADNYFRGREGDDTFDFSAGDDIGEGGAGADTFIFRGGNFNDDVIKDFEDGIDMIQIADLLDFSELTISDDGDDKLIEWATSTIRLEGLADAAIDENDFILPLI